MVIGEQHRKDGGDHQAVEMGFRGEGCQNKRIEGVKAGPTDGCGAPFQQAENQPETQQITDQSERLHAERVIGDGNGGSHDLMQTAACGVIASGTATLEAATFGLPYCLVYKMAWTTYFLGKLLVKIKYIGLVNILAGEKVVEEFIQADASPTKVSHWLQNILSNDEQRADLVARLQQVSSQLGDPGTHRRAAERVSEWLNFKP